MQPSPIGSKLLSAYGILFVGIAPLMLSIVGFINGAIELSIHNILLASAVIYFGARVFVGHRPSTRWFAVLVALHYFGLIATNFWYGDEFPPESRAAAMAVPRMIRGLLFGALYLWYYLIRKRTANGFQFAAPEMDATKEPIQESSEPCKSQDKVQDVAQ